MPNLQFVASLCPTTVKRKTAFCTPFDISDFQTKSECSVTVDNGKHLTGCSVSRLDISIHSSAPHLETAAHVLGSTYFPYSLSDVFPQGVLESCALVTPKITRLADSGDSYPIGHPDDYVICMRELKACLDELDYIAGCDSIIVRIEDKYLPEYSGTIEIQSWPYLTPEAGEFLGKLFSHYRTNSPSLETCMSEGGMWSHCAFFGLDTSRPVKVSGPIKRTVGELFYIPEEIKDGLYCMMCPYFDVGLDCSITSPLLFKSML